MHRKTIQKQDIILLLKSSYQLETESIQSLQSGADMNALTYKADAKSKSYFIKIKFNHHEETHLDVVRFLHDAGLKEIIFPLAADDGKLFKKFQHGKMIVYPFIHGHNGFEQALARDQWISLGKSLKEIHTLPVNATLKKQLPLESFSTKWCDAVKKIFNQIEPNLSDDASVAQFKHFFKTHFNAIFSLVNLTEKLVKTLRPDSNNYVLCHTDIHAGNILISSDQSLYIVDWDEPMMAPKERDLMFIGGGVGNVWNLLDETAYFYEGYGKTEIDENALTYYRCNRILEDIALYAEDILSPASDPQEKLISLKYFTEMFKPKGVVDIAFQITKNQ